MNIMHFLPGKIWGGAEQYALDLGEALKSKGHKVSYLSYPSNAVMNRMKGIENYSCLKLNRFRNSKELISLVKDKDVIHIHDIRHLAAIMRACDKIGSKPEFVLTRHIARASKVMPWDRKYLLRLKNMIFVSSFAKDLWLSVNPWMPVEKCSVVINSIPTVSPHAPQTIRERFSITDRTPLMVFTGRIRKSKGCENIIKALSLLKDMEWKMVFIGACKPVGYDEYLTKMAIKNGIGDKVHFYGFADNVRDLIREADLGLAPSIVREACHLSSLEYMQNGICVITSNNGAQKEYIESGKTGILINSSSFTELSGAIRSMLNDEDKRVWIGNHEKIYFENHLSYPIFLNNILKIYETNY